MKDDKPKGKSQKDQSGPGISDSQMPSVRKENTEEDVDFEILDALEQIEQSGKGEGEQLTDEEDKFELSLDGEDLLFDEDETGEASEFHFDESLAAGLDEDLTGKPEAFSLDEALGEGAGEDVHGDLEDDTFALDLDQDEELEGEGALPFDVEMDLDLKTETGEDLGDIGDIDFTPETERVDSLTAESDEMSTEMLDFGEEPADAVTEDELSLGTDLSEQERADLGLEDTDETFGEIDLGDMSDLGGEFNFEAETEDESSADLEFSAMDFEDEAEDLTGKAVISVGAEEVIDLGHETDFDQDTDVKTTPDAYQAVAQEPEETFDLGKEGAAEDLGELEEETQHIVDNVVATLPSEEEPAEEVPAAEERPEELVTEEPAEEFQAELEDLNIDLEEETTKVLETLEGADEFSGLSEEEPAGFDADDFEIPPEQEHAAEVAPTVGEGILAQTLITPVAEQPEEVAKESAPPQMEPDEREALGLTPRLTEPEIQKFESMVNEAKTLQRYAEELEGHKTEIKEKIYQKLLKEYTSRKADLFKEPEFVSIRIDVEQDLEEMLARRTEFVMTIDRLNDELEEVKVRHLVGEYTDATRAEREAAQQTEITQWHAQTEKIEQFITRYQELLETERKLNPLEEEPSIAAVPKEIRPEPKVVAPPEKLVPPEEASFAEKDAEEETFLADLEESFPEEEEEDRVPVAEESEESESASLEMEVESLADTFGDELSEDFGLDEFPEIPGVSEIEADVTEESSVLAEPAVEPTAAAQKPVAEETPQEEMITCKKCKRLTPAAEKFCVNCGAKAR